MAKCGYTLLGRSFGSELELNNFLLNNKHSIDLGRVSDIVFSLNSKKDEVVSILDNKLSWATKIQRIKRNPNSILDDEDIDPESVKPYKGVTSALRLFKQPNGKQFVPNFDLDNYKNNDLFPRWAEKGYNQAEAELLGKEAGVPVNPSEFELAFNSLVGKWDLLGKVGTSLHKVAELFWKGKSLSEIIQDSEVNNYLDAATASQMYGHMEVLRNQLINLHGGGDPANVKFYPEYVVTGDTQANDDDGNPIKLLGIIDLLVVDSDGQVHIYDYKTSDKALTGWNETKKLTFDYQLAVYRQLLEQYGVPVNSSMLGIIPFTMQQFDGTTGSFESLATPTYMVNGNKEINIDYRSRNPRLAYEGASAFITNNVESIMPVEPKEDLITKDFVEHMSTGFTKLFPGYKFNRELNDATLEALKKDVRFNPSTNKWTLPDLKNPGKTLTFDSQAEAYKALESYHEALLSSKTRATERLIGNIRTAINTGNTNFLPLSNRKIKGHSAGWFIKECSRYCNSEWKVMDVPELTSLGMMLLFNKRAKYFDVLVLDNTPLKTQLKFKKGTTVLGEYASNVELEQRGIPALEGIVGNIDLMKAMLALNELPDLFREGKFKLGEIRVLNQKDETGMHTSAWQLMQNFNELTKNGRAGVDNNFSTGRIQFLENYQLAYYNMVQFCALGREQSKLNNVLSEFETNPIILDHSIENLIKMKKMLEQEYPNLTETKTTDFSSPPGIVYGYLLKAIKDLRGMHYVQEVRDGSKIALLIDNPDVMESANLRNMYKVTTDGLVHLRTNLNNFAAEMRTAMEKFWKAKGYSTERRNLIGDQLSLFKNMFVKDRDGNIDSRMRVKSPFVDRTLDAAEKEFLTFWLDRLNRYRFQNISESDLEEMRLDPDSAYYDVPLMEASSATKVQEGGKGLISWFKRKVDQFRNPKEWADRLITGALDSEHGEQLKEDMEKYEMIDMFEYSDNQTSRSNALEEHDTVFFETNLNDIIYSYAFVKERKKAYDEILPVVKATMVDMLMEANFQNLDIKNTVGYTKDYVKNKIIGQTLVPENLKGLSHYMGMIRNFTTTAALGFSPKSGLFQMMEGFWKNAGKAIIRPMGTNQFGWDEVQQAMKWVAGDMKDHFKIVSLGELINEQYAINDFDSNVYDKRLRGEPGFINFQGKMLWTTSAPDYFNRMTLFVAQMIKDGCIDAYSKKGNSLVYDWKKDKRFSAYAAGNKSDSKYGYQKALYEAMIDQFRNEGWKNDKGQPISYGDDLPMAYTNKEAQSLKSFADQTYGYYSHETQMMLKSYFLGAQYMQFRTYWSALKNRYFLRGGVYSQGNFQQLVDEAGNKVYKKLVTINGVQQYVQTTENTGEPFMVWRGNWQEGIFMSIRDGFKDMLEGFRDDGLAGAWKGAKEFWRTDNEEQRRVRHANLKQFTYDMALWTLIGGLLGYFLTQLLKEQQKADKGRNLSWGDVMLRDAESILVSSLVTSTDDLGAFESMLSPLTDWTPPSFRMLTNIWNDGCAVITGDKDFSKAVINNIGVLRQTRNFWCDASEAVESAIE